MENQKGFSNLLILLAIALAIGIFLYAKDKNFFNKMMTDETPSEKIEEKKMEEFEQLEEDETTPEEINDESVEELDTLMLEIDASSNEDLSDLDL